MGTCRYQFGAFGLADAVAGRKAADASAAAVVAMARMGRAGRSFMVVCCTGLRWGGGG